MSFNKWYKEYERNMKIKLEKLFKEPSSKYQYLLNKEIIDDTGTVLKYTGDLEKEEMELLVELCNEFDDKIKIKHISKEKGYGLFANKLIEEDHFITFYGGEVT